MKAKYRVAIAGCGNIAGFLDTPRDKQIATYAHALRKAGDFKLTCCCDPDARKVAAFRKRWGKNIKAYSGIDDMLKSEKIDVLCICADTKNHAALLLKAFKAGGIKAIICEKPLVEAKKQFTALLSAIKAAPKKHLVVNFSRRYDPDFKKVEEALSGGSLGKPLVFSAVFNKGLYHNGCHMFELLGRLFGRLKSVEVMENIPFDGDFCGEFFLKYRYCRGSMHSLPKSRYSCFDLDIFCEKGKIQITGSGAKINIFKKAKSSYPGFYELALFRRIGGAFKHNNMRVIDFTRGLLRRGSRENRVLSEHLKVSRDLLKIKHGLSKGRLKLTF